MGTGEVRSHRRRRLYDGRLLRDGDFRYYLLRRQDVKFATSSFRMAALFGVVATIMTVHMGDESAFLVTRDQPTKIAAMEAVWDTKETPAPLALFALPDQEARTNHAEIEVPWLFGIMGTRSLSTPIPGINQLEAQALERIERGQKALAVLETLRQDPKNESLRAEFTSLKDDLGFGLLLKRYTDDVQNATDEMKKAAAASTIPQVAPMFCFPPDGGLRPRDGACLRARRLLLG